MNSAFSPVLMMLFVWVLIGVPIAIARKAAQQNKPARPAAPKAPPAEQPVQAEQPAAPDRLVPVSPSIFVTEHDDSVYQGSMNAVTGEGWDPCHEEQLSTLTQARQQESAPRPAQAGAGLSLGWTGNDVVRGIVMSEILKRKH